MDQSSNSEAPTGQYDAAYENFQSDLYEQIRREAFGEDIGQNSWPATCPESGRKILLITAPSCGSGGANRLSGNC